MFRRENIILSTEIVYNMNKNLPDGWIIKKSWKTNEEYYFNKITGKAQWEFPVETNKKVIGEGT